MSTQAAVQTSWRYMGAYFVFFLGWVIGLLGCIDLHRGHDATAITGSTLAAYGLVGAGVVLFVVGSQILARIKGPSSIGDPVLVVSFFMTPLPAIVGFGINCAGNYLRRAEAMPLRMGLVGLGVFLLAVSGMWLSEGLHVSGGQNDLRGFFWTTAIQGGIAAPLLALLPKQTSAAPAPVPDAA